MNRRAAATWAGVIVAVLLASASVGAAGVTGKAPEFTRNDLAGKPLNLADYRGKVVLLNFWATWCAPCLEEIPIFVGWQRQYGPAGLQILGVSMDDDATPVNRFLKKTPLDYPVMLGDTALAKLYGGVLGLPLTYLIDANGTIVSRYLGETDLKVMESRLKDLLANRQH